MLQLVADFSFESAKACHAVVLTTMEFDCYDYRYAYSVSAKLYSNVIKCTGPGNNGQTNVNIVKNDVKNAHDRFVVGESIRKS